MGLVQLDNRYWRIQGPLSGLLDEHTGKVLNTSTVTTNEGTYNQPTHSTALAYPFSPGAQMRGPTKTPS